MAREIALYFLFYRLINATESFLLQASSSSSPQHTITYIHHHIYTPSHIHHRVCTIAYTHTTHIQLTSHQQYCMDDNCLTHFFGVDISYPISSKSSFVKDNNCGATILFIISIIHLHK